MYKELINEEVSIVVATKSEMLLEYNGLLVEESTSSLILKDVTVNQVMLNFQRNVFGSGISVYKQFIGKVILNKDYVISCNK